MELRMFAAAWYRQNFVHIKRVHYETCPDFGEVYAVVWNKSGRRPPLDSSQLITLHNPTNVEEEEENRTRENRLDAQRYAVYE